MSHQHHKVLMNLLEELINFLNREKIQYWIDWGTMLGYIRHRNVIPWDYDADLCMMSDQYDKLIDLFKQKNDFINNGYRIGRLLCLPQAYNDDGCLWISDSEAPECHLGVDVIRYKRTGDQIVNCMKEEIVKQYPCTFGSYDFSVDDIFPLRTGIMLGLSVSLPNKIEQLVERGYGPDYLKYPESEYKKWYESLGDLKEHSDKYLNPPFRLMEEFNTLDDGLDYYEKLPKGQKAPFIVRQCWEFAKQGVNDMSITKVFRTEKDVMSWHETADELFNDTYHDGEKLYQDWVNNRLIYNIVDAPNVHLELLPDRLKANIQNLSERGKLYASCYAMTKSNNLTKYHEDVLGEGWVYLECGVKIWTFISLKDVEYLQEHGYSLFSIKELNFTELVFLLDGYLWGKIWAVQMNPKDFIYFPQRYAHRVITYDKSLGICGYTMAP